MSSVLAQRPEAVPNPPTFTSKDNPAFILHSALKTSYEEVGFFFLAAQSRKEGRSDVL
jgi:hypothetical protein